MSTFARFWKEEDGFLVSLELILAAVMLVFGMIAGMQVLRDATAQELADLGMAIGAINNSYTITGILGPTINGNESGVLGSTFTDFEDECDVIAAANGDPAGGIVLGQAGVAEGGT